jgi:hypothetical protein
MDAAVEIEAMCTERMVRSTAVLAVAALCSLTFGCVNSNNHAGKTPTTTTTPAFIAPPLQERAMDGLLLNPDQINAAMGAKDMTVTKTHNTMSDDSATMEPRECLAVDGSAQAQIYAGSGFTAERDLSLQDGDNFTHYVDQAVVLFPTAKQAAAFVANSAKQWPACHHYTHIQTRSQWDAGPASNTNGVLSVTTTEKDAKAPGWACGRALLARNNVVVDVNTCSPDPGDTAVKIANQIASKVAA